MSDQTYNMTLILQIDKNIDKMYNIFSNKAANRKLLGYVVKQERDMKRKILLVVMFLVKAQKSQIMYPLKIGLIMPIYLIYIIIILY